MPVLIALILAIPTLIGLVYAWYWLVNWGEIHLKPRYGDHKGFVLAAIVIPIAFFAVLTGISVLLGREYGAYLFGAVMLGFAVLGITMVYIRLCWRD